MKPPTLQCASSSSSPSSLSALLRMLQLLLYLTCVCIPCASHCLQDNTQQINSLDFHRTADLLVTASHDDIIYVYDTAQGKRLLTEVPSRKYGAQNVVWTHSTELILFASNKVREQL